ncbi:MAG TPA: hypothetical protein VFB99_18240, partial [Vicinamibacterales bacterium]|nr:hypothetical protein [Vicinamibacterales bacterium]
MDGTGARELQSGGRGSEGEQVAGAEGFRLAVSLPRVSWVPPHSRTLGDDCIAFWESHGGSLFEWQKLAIRGMLGVGEDGRFVSANDGLCVPRQNGKGVVLQAVETFFAFELGYPLVMHTAHEFATSQEHQRRLDTFVQDAPTLHARVLDRGGYRHANGQESINLKNGSRIAFKARTKGGGRGWSGDLLVWDEAMIIPETVVGAQKPTLRASKAPHGQKTIYAGSAVDMLVHEYGVSFAKIRESGHARSPRVCWFEWAAPFDDPSEMDDSVLHDESWWPVANPSMAEGLISRQSMLDDLAVMPARTVAVEYGNVGDWPATDGSDDYVIHIDAWDALRDFDSQLQAPFVLGVDVSPERRSSIAAAGQNQDGRFHVEVHEHRPGTDWLVPRLMEMWDSGLVSVVVVDAVGPAASMLQALRDAGLPLETVNTPEHGQACGRLVDLVAEGGLAHLGSDELRDAIRGARSRP